MLSELDIFKRSLIIVNIKLCLNFSISFIALTVNYLHKQIQTQNKIKKPYKKRTIEKMNLLIVQFLVLQKFIHTVIGLLQAPFLLFQNPPATLCDKWKRSAPSRTTCSRDTNFPADRATKHVPATCHTAMEMVCDLFMVCDIPGALFTLPDYETWPRFAFIVVMANLSTSDFTYPFTLLPPSY